MTRLLHSSRLGRSSRYDFQWPRRIFCSDDASISGGYLFTNLDSNTRDSD